MPKEQRAELHERFAGWLEGAAGERLPEYEEILAHHLEQAYRYRLELGPVDEHARELASAAAGRLLSAADRAHGRGDFAAARVQLERAAGLLEGSERARALAQLAMTERHRYDFRAAAARAEEAMAEAEAAGDRVAWLRAQMIGGEARGQIDPSYTLSRWRREVGEALAELEALRDERGLVWGTLAAARSEFYAGRCDRATELIEELLARAPALSAPESREAAITLGISGYFGTADPDELERISVRMKQVVTVDGPLGQATVAMNSLARHALRGEEAEALAEIEQIGQL